MALIEATALSDFLDSFGSVTSWFIDQAKVIGTTIVNTPVLLIGLAVPVVGGAIGLFGRLLRRS